MGERPVPDQWTDGDRRRFLTIAKRRKEEHASSYAVVAIGAQLFLSLTDNRVSIVNNEAEGDAADVPDVVCDSDANGDAPTSAHAQTET